MNEPIEEPTPDTVEVDLYPPLETIDFMKIYRTFTDTALFDDVYLGMQGMKEHRPCRPGCDGSRALASSSFHRD